MKRIIIASKNPVKVEAARRGFGRLFPDERFEIEMVDVASGVADQPMSDEATREGAINRARNGSMQIPDADYWVGIEGGCDYLDEDLVSFAWICVFSKDGCGYARTTIFQLPREVQTLVEGGLELGDADDRVFGQKNSKQDAGAVGLLTGNVVTRTSLYEQAVILALIPFKNAERYRSKE